MVPSTIARNVILFTCGFYTTTLFAQNLVKNPSFETFVECPKTLGNFDLDVTNWSSPSEGSTDYFNACSEAMGTPKNFNGTQPADFGKGYVGLYFYAPANYREYIQAHLKQPLLKGRKYRVSFYVSLAERSDFAVKEFGVLFANNKVSMPIKKVLSKGQLYKDLTNKYSFIEIGYSNFYSDTKDWIQVYTQYTAKGGERYMVLGNFKNNDRTRLFKTKKDAKQGAYYYLDMVRVEATEDSKALALAEIADENEKKSYELDKIHIIKNLLFEFDRFQIKEQAKNEMQRLFESIKTDSALKVSINGHTDSVGSETYNQWLSSKRAEAVAQHLERLGLDKERIEWHGYGGTKPVATNDSENGRQQNRRVEFVISKRSL